MITLTPRMRTMLTNHMDRDIAPMRPMSPTVVLHALGDMLPLSIAGDLIAVADAGNTVSVDDSGTLVVERPLLRLKASS